MAPAKFFVALLLPIVLFIADKTFAEKEQHNEESKAQVLVDGKELPKLKGLGCKQYKACCEKGDGTVSLACQLDQAAYPDDNCVDLLKRIRQLIVELQKDIPAVCEIREE